MNTGRLVPVCAFLSPKNARAKSFHSNSMSRDMRRHLGICAGKEGRAPAAVLRFSVQGTAIARLLAAEEAADAAGAAGNDSAAGRARMDFNNPSYAQGSPVGQRPLGREANNTCSRVGNRVASVAPRSSPSAARDTFVVGKNGVLSRSCGRESRQYDVGNRQIYVLMFPQDSCVVVVQYGP